MNGTPANARAVLDIGSNTVRLVVFAGPLRAPVVVLNEKVTAKLGRDLAQNGLIPEKAMDSALTALARYRLLLDGIGVAQADVVATAAARDAANGAEFLGRVRELGFSPRLLSGSEEAETSAAGVLAAFPRAAGIVADLGGGSLELVDIADDHSAHGVSLPLGTLRLVALREQGSRKFQRRLNEILASSGWTANSGQDLYLVGGSWRALARLAINLTGWPLKDPHAFKLTPERITQLIASATKSDGLRASDVAGISASRLASLPDAASLLGVLMRALKPGKVTFSSWGLREGLLYRRLDQAARSQNPLTAGVTSFAERFGGTPGLAIRVAAWTAAAVTPDGENRETLRLAATQLALVTPRIEPNLRDRHSLDWALHKRWIGIDAAERAMLAAALLANGGKLELPDQLLQLAEPRDLEEAQAWGLAVRLFRRLGACSNRVLGETSLSRKGPHLVLSLDDALRPLVNDPSQRDLATLASRLRLEPEIAFSAAPQWSELDDPASA